jgi:hypothetical protein
MKQKRQKLPKKLRRKRRIGRGLYLKKEVKR